MRRKSNLRRVIVLIFCTLKYNFEGKHVKAVVITNQLSNQCFDVFKFLTIALKLKVDLTTVFFK